MELGTAFFVGLLGSLHCAGMCGPLTLALPGAGRGPIAFCIGRIAYNFGRLTSYACLGLLFGTVGRTFGLAGVQRWASIGAGLAVWAALLLSSRVSLGIPITQAVAGLKRGFAGLLHKRTTGTLILLGVLNGLLPCGLVYAACAGALAYGGLINGVAYMLMFGLGTLPMMLTIGLAGKRLQFALRFRFARLVPAGMAMLGALLILRGLSLGIPYLSPDLSGTGCSCH